VDERAVAHTESPIVAVLREVGVRDRLKLVVIADPHRLAFHHEVEPVVDRV
jgi:hypothetical protein